MFDLNDQFYNNEHPITITVVGCGGTGSRLIIELAKLNKALIALGHVGIHVCGIDFDSVDENNPVRQQFYESEIGMNKADAVIGRVNRSYGFNWISKNESFMKKDLKCNLLITCVDNIKTRVYIDHLFNKHDFVYQHTDYNSLFAWIDIGNNKSDGQIYVSLPGKQSLLKRFPQIANQKDDNSTSCSVQESLNNQDLYINSFMALYCSNMLWRWFKSGKITYTEIFINILNFNITTNENRIKSMELDGNISEIR